MEERPNNKLPFSQPQRQSPAAIIIMMLHSAISTFKTLWPALLVFLFRANKQNETPKVLIAVLLFGGLTIIFTLLRYFFYYFHIHNNNLVITTGWLKKKTLSIPLASIQAVHLEQNVWQQVFKVFKVSFDSAGSEKVEAKIDALDVLKAEQLKKLLLSASAAPVLEEEPENGLRYKLQPGDILKMSLSANHLEAFSILLAISVNLLDDLKKIFGVDGYGWVERMGGTAEENIIYSITFLIVFAAIISIGFSGIRTFIKYYDFTLTSEFQKWKISFGLLDRHQRIIPHSKIQVYSWHANWLRRKINFWMLNVKTIGHNAIKGNQKLKIPLTSIQAAFTLATVYQHAKVVVPQQGAMIAPEYWRRRSLLVALPVTFLLMTMGYIWLQWYCLWIGLIFFYFVFTNYQWFKNFRWYANDEGLQRYSGVWGRRYVLLRWNKVQKVVLSQSLYQRRKQLASLNFITAGGAVSIPYIALKHAEQLADIVLFIIEEKNEDWM